MTIGKISGDLQFAVWLHRFSVIMGCTCLAEFGLDDKAVACGVLLSGGESAEHLNHLAIAAAEL
jgi:hypothetical protein